MSKAVRWQVPFADINGNRYRVDIYDEGYSGNPVVLKAGDTPFTTKEDDSDDFFAPIRTQTGTLQICTKIPGSGTPLKLEDLLPANNIARPVRLNRINSSGTVLAIEWQGFLSCEAYSQAYVSTPENISFPVISVLEAMDSVEVELSENMAFQRILSHCIYAMKAIETKSGMSLFNMVFLDGHCQYETIANYFYNNVYYTTEEQISGDNVVVDIHSISCKKILEQVATFFGCCWREASGQNIYFEAVGKANQFVYDTFTNMYNSLIAGTSILNLQSVNPTTVNLSSQSWMGTNHKRSVTQGMRRVKVTSKLDDFECKIALEETPVNNLVENPDARQSTWGEVHCNTNETFYNLAEHKHMQATVTCDYTQVSATEYDSEGGFNETVYERGVASAAFKNYVQSLPYLHTQFWENTQLLTGWYQMCNPSLHSGSSHSEIDTYLTSFMTWFRDRENELQSGLMVYGLPKNASNEVEGNTFTFTNNMLPTSGKHVFKQGTAFIFSAASGYMRLNLETIACGNDGKMDGNVYTYPIPKAFVALKFGDKWAYKDGSTYKWSSSFHYLEVEMEGDGNSGKLTTKGNWNENMGIDEIDGLLIPISSSMSGIVSVFVYPIFQGMAQAYNWGSWWGSSELFMMLFSTIDVQYVLPNGELQIDRSENVYATETSQAFRDELSVDCELASYANNTKLATMIWQSDGVTPVKLMNLDGVSVRPEVNLLNRLAAYYGAARQRLELEVEHPTNAPLPLLKLNGIGDGKVYLPLSEQRNWRTNECKLICMENPS